MSVSAPPRLPSLVLTRWEGAFLGLLLVSVLTGCSSSGETEDSVREIDPQRSSLTVDRTTDVAGDGKDTVFGTVRIVDTKGAPVLRAEVRIRAKGIGGGEQVFNLPSTNAEGITEFELASRGLGTLSLEVIAGLDGRRKTLTQKVEVTFIAGPPAELVFVAFPVQVPAGRTFDVPVMVAARDAAGNPVTRPFPVPLYLAADSTANRLEGTLSVTAVHSSELGRAVATFPDVRVLGAGAARLVADSPTSRISSVNFTVYPGPVAGLRFNGTLPEVVEAGAALTPAPSVSTVDAHGNVTASTTVGVELLLQDAQGHESPLAPNRHDSSPILFPDVRVDRAGTGYRLVARSGQLTAATSTPFTVRSGTAEVAASSLRASPPRLPAGPSSQATLRVQLLSRSGNPVADAPVRLSVSGTGHVLVPESGEGRTDARGVFSATLASESERVVQVTATSGDVVLETEVAFVAECAATTALSYLPTLGDTPLKGSVLPVDLDGDGDLDAVSSEGTVHDNAGDGTLVLRLPDPDRVLGHVSAGDLDGDGAPDVLSVGPNVSVRFNRGDGSLFPPRVFVWSAFASEGRLVDVNGDGWLDVAYLKDQGGWWTVHVLLNQGGGWFAPAVTTAFREDRWFGGRLALVARGPGGGVDLVATGRGSLTELFTGDGAGGFVPARSLTLPESATAMSPADEDGDGREDLFFHLGNGGLALLRNQGQGTFAAPVRLDLGVSVGALAVMDLDGDGRKDLAFNASSSEFQLWMVRRDADGGFRAKEAVGRSIRATGVSAGDLTGDGRPELLVSSPSGVLPLLNQGNGSFLTPAFLLGSNFTSRLGVGDFNGDGVVDLAGMGSFTELLLSQPDGTRTSRLFATPSSSVRDAIATDLDRDGLMDLVFSDFINRIHVLRSTGGGDFAATTLILTDVVSGPLAAGDLDGDGAPEVVVLHPGQDSATVLRNDGTGSLREGEALPMGADPQALALADLDGDEDLDLVVADSEAGTVQRYANDGHGALTLQSTEVVGLAPESLAVGDLDGDGRPEVVVSNRDEGTVSVLPGAGGPARKFPVGSQPRGLALGDFNRDGWQDLAVASEGNLRLALLLGQAGGGFSPPRWQGPMDWPSRLLAHDWDGDGRVDLLVAHSGAVDLLRPTCVR